MPPRLSVKPRQGSVIESMTVSPRPPGKLKSLPQGRQRYLRVDGRGVKEKSSKVEDAIEDTGKKAHSKFRDAVGDIGKEMVGAISPDIKQQLSSRVEDVVGGAFKSASAMRVSPAWLAGLSPKPPAKGSSRGSTVSKTKSLASRTLSDTTKKAFAEPHWRRDYPRHRRLSDSFGRLGTMAEQFGVDVGRSLPKPIRMLSARQPTGRQLPKVLRNSSKECPVLLAGSGQP